MQEHASAEEKRIADEHPRPTLTCALCGTASTKVRRFSGCGERIPPHTACPGCAFNPVTDSLDEFMEALRA
jgi:hypothetical protein